MGAPPWAPSPVLVTQKREVGLLGTAHKSRPDGRALGSTIGAGTTVAALDVGELAGGSVGTNELIATTGVGAGPGVFTGVSRPHPPSSSAANARRARIAILDRHLPKEPGRPALSAPLKLTMSALFRQPDGPGDPADPVRV